VRRTASYATSPRGWSPPSRRHRATGPTGRASTEPAAQPRSLVPAVSLRVRLDGTNWVAPRPSRPCEAGHLLRPEPLRAAAGSHLLQQEAAHDWSGGEWTFSCHASRPPRCCCLGCAVGRPSAVLSLPITSTHDRSPPSTVLRRGYDSADEAETPAPLDVGATLRASDRQSSPGTAAAPRSTGGPNAARASRPRPRRVDEPGTRLRETLRGSSLRPDRDAPQSQAASRLGVPHQASQPGGGP
jgi:hypothetical protein